MPTPVNVSCPRTSSRCWSTTARLALDDVNQKLWETLAQLEPFGAGNPRPTFVARGAKLMQPPRIMKETHLKLRVTSAAMAARSGRMTSWAGEWPNARKQESLLLGDVLDLAFTVDFNTHPDFGGVQLTLSDFARLDVPPRRSYHAQNYFTDLLLRR